MAPRLVKRPKRMSLQRMLASYRRSHERLGESERGATCIKDKFGDTRCPLCKRYDAIGRW